MGCQPCRRYRWLDCGRGPEERRLLRNGRDVGLPAPIRTIGRRVISGARGRASAGSDGSRAVATAMDDP